jgi:hypothetical protein
VAGPDKKRYKYRTADGANHRWRTPCWREVPTRCPVRVERAVRVVQFAQAEPEHGRQPQGRLLSRSSADPDVFLLVYRLDPVRRRVPSLRQLDMDEARGGHPDHPERGSAAKWRRSVGSPRRTAGVAEVEYAHRSEREVPFESVSPPGALARARLGRERGERFSASDPRRPRRHAAAGRRRLARRAGGGRPRQPLAAPPTLPTIWQSGGSGKAPDHLPGRSTIG